MYFCYRTTIKFTKSAKLHIWYLYCLLFSRDCFINICVIYKIEVDMVSYQGNVAKFIEVCRDLGDKKTMKYLWKLTFEGRRKEIVSNKFDNVQHLLKTACPVLNQPEYVSCFKILF